MSSVRFTLVPKLRLGRFESMHRREAELGALRSQAELGNEVKLVPVPLPS